MSHGTGAESAGQQDSGDAALLAAALGDALAAHASGELAAPWGVDEVALQRAERRARRRDAAQATRRNLGVAA